MLPTILSIVLAIASFASAGQTGRVAAVVDGDTVILEDGRRVRYLGTNTPERGERLHEEAKDLNRSLVMGKTVRLELENNKDNDAYGRLLAYVYAGETMVNARLIQEGMAHAFFIGPEGRHDALFLKLQAEARQRGVRVAWFNARESGRLAGRACAAETFTQAAEAGQADGDAPAVAEMLNNLCVVRMAEMNWPAAIAAAHGTPEVFQAAGDRTAPDGGLRVWVLVRPAQR